MRLAAGSAAAPLPVLEIDQPVVALDVSPRRRAHRLRRGQARGGGQGQVAALAPDPAAGRRAARRCSCPLRPRRAGAEPVVLSARPPMKALALDGVGGLEHLARARAASPGARGARRRAGPDPRGRAQPPRSLRRRRPAGRELQLSAHRGLGRGRGGRGGGTRRDRGRPGRPGDDQSRHLLRHDAPRAGTARSRSARPSAWSASTGRARPPSTWSCPPRTWRPCRPGCRGRRRRRSRSRRSPRGGCSPRARALRAGRDGADLGHRRRASRWPRSRSPGTSAPAPS